MRPHSFMKMADTECLEVIHGGKAGNTHRGSGQTWVILCKI
jgi:hypothetical protein